MMTGDQYKASLDDGRVTYFQGERVLDLPSHPAFASPVARVADGYDQMYSPEPSAISPLMKIARSPEDLRERIPLLQDAGQMALVTYASLMTLMTAANRLDDSNQEFVERIATYVGEAQARDIRITQCITDAKGDRSRHPSRQDDPDAYTRVVDRSSDGVVIRGAKLHISGASLGHDLMVIPTKSMRPEERQYSIACMVPVNAPGVRIVNITSGPYGRDERSFPISARFSHPEGFVIFDDVFVPANRIFLDGDTERSATFAHALGLWVRLGGLSYLADGADVLVGLAQLIAEANGLASISHIREKISEMIVYAGIVRATLEAAIVNCQSGEQGTVFPDEFYTNAGKYYAVSNYNLMLRHLHDIAGGSAATAPSVADLENLEVGPLIRKYMSTSHDVDGTYRTRLFHAIRDLTADTYGGWKSISIIQAGGGLFAQGIVTRKHYDLEGAKQKAMDAAGLCNEL